MLWCFMKVWLYEYGFLDSCIYIHFCICLFPADLPLWLQTDGVPEWIALYMHTHKLTPPSLSTSSSYIQRSIVTAANTAAALSASANEGHQLTVADLHDMYIDMFTTAFEIIQDSNSSSK